MASSRASKPTILAVDDCAVTQKVIQRTLQENYRVLLANNAMDALTAIYEEPIELLLLDILMPGIDGLELCRTVRKLPQFETLPIIMLTSRTRAFDKAQGWMAGATEYLTKPFDPEQLHQIVQYFLDPSLCPLQLRADGN